MASIWSALGPNHLTGLPGRVLPCAGRIDGIAITPDYDGAGHAAMYLAMPGGGVWRSTDFTLSAPTWIPLTDHIPGLTDIQRVNLNVITTLAVDPSNPRTIYAGTGGSSTVLLKSADGGNSWTLVGEGGFGVASGVSRILVDPLGSAYVAFGSGGFWQSTDRGATWTNIASGS